MHHPNKTTENIKKQQTKQTTNKHNQTKQTNQNHAIYNHISYNKQQSQKHTQTQNKIKNTSNTQIKPHRHTTKQVHQTKRQTPNNKT